MFNVQLNVSNERFRLDRSNITKSVTNRAALRKGDTSVILNITYVAYNVNVVPLCLNSAGGLDGKILAMSIRVDPEENELRALEAAADWRGKRVLEIGCGDGRLTLRLAQLGAVVRAEDPDPVRVQKAREALRPELSGSVSYAAGTAERLDHSDGSFDMAVFAWSL